MDPLGGQVLHHDCIPVIVSRFAIVTENLGTAPPLRLLHGALVIFPSGRSRNFGLSGSEYVLCLPKSSLLLDVGGL